MRGRNLNCRALQPSRAQKCWQSVWAAAAVGVDTTGFLRVRDTVFINSVNGLLLALLHYLSPLALADSFAGRPCSGGTVQCQLSELNAGNRDSGGGGGGLCEHRRGLSLYLHCLTRSHQRSVRTLGEHQSTAHSPGFGVV